MITTVLDTNIGEDKNKIPSFRDLFKKVDYNAQMTLRKNVLPTSHYHKFKSEMFEPKRKEEKLVGKSNISNLVKNFI